MEFLRIYNKSNGQEEFCDDIANDILARHRIKETQKEGFDITRVLKCNGLPFTENFTEIEDVTNQYVC